MAKWVDYFQDDFTYKPQAGKTLVQDEHSPLNTVDPFQPGHFLFQDGWDEHAPANVKGRVKFLVKLFFDKDASQNHGGARTRLAWTGDERQNVFIYEARVSTDKNYLEICWGNTALKFDTIFNVKLSEITPPE